MLKAPSSPASRRRFSAQISTVLLTSVALISISGLAQAQPYEANVNPDSPEGQFLELIGLQSDGAKKLGLIEQFTQRYPKNPAIAWAYQQLQESAFQAGEWDKTLAFGEKLVGVNPDDIDAVQMNIKAAESKGDRTTVKLWTDYATRVAQKTLVSPAPKDPEKIEEWKKRVAIASQYAALDEYAIYKKASEASDPRQQIKLLDELLQRNPDSMYLPQALILYLNAYRGLGDSRNALLTAERILRTDQNNEDALLLAAEGYLQRNSAPDKVVAYSARIVELMNTKKKPGGVREEDWDKKKSVYLGMAHWMTGNTYINQNRFGAADGALRAALPYLRQTDQTASVLFYLGWANYKLDNLDEAARFYKQCMAIPGQFQDQAAKNLAVIRTEHEVKD